MRDPWFSLAVQKNPEAVEIINETSVPDDFKSEVVSVKIDKAAIKQTIRGGGEVPGATLIQGTRLAIR